MKVPSSLQPCHWVTAMTFSARGCSGSLALQTLFPSPSHYRLKDWSSSLLNNTSDPIGTSNFWQPRRSSRSIFNPLSQIYQQNNAQPLKHHSTFQQCLKKTAFYQTYFLYFVQTVQSDKAPLHCTNTERAKRKWKQGIKQRKDVYNGTGTSYFFLFVFLFGLKIEHNAYFCVETTD